MESFIIADIYVPKKELKRIAKVLLKAQDIREESWDYTGDYYTKSNLEATKEAMTGVDINKRMEPIIYRWLDCSWNESQDWAKGKLQKKRK